MASARKQRLQVAAPSKGVVVVATSARILRVHDERYPASGIPRDHVVAHHAVIVRAADVVAQSILQNVLAEERKVTRGTPAAIGASRPTPVSEATALVRFHGGVTSPRGVHCLADAWHHSPAL